MSAPVSTRPVVLVDARCLLGPRTLDTNDELADRLRWFARSGFDIVIWGGDLRFAEQARRRAHLRIKHVRCATRTNGIGDTADARRACGDRLPVLQYDTHAIGMIPERDASDVVRRTVAA